MDREVSPPSSSSPQAQMPPQAQGCPFSKMGAEYMPFAGPVLQDPYAFYAQSQKEDPIFFSPVLGMWVATRYDDIVAMLKDTARFSSAGMFIAGTELIPEAQALWATGYPMVPTALDTDPPEHGRMRRFISRLLTGKRVEQLRPEIERFTDHLIDTFVSAQKVDIISQFAEPLPIHVILHMLGIPEADRSQIKRWCNDLFSLVFTRVPPELQLDRVKSVVAYQKYCESLIQERMRKPKDDGLSDLVRPGDDGDAPLSMAELISVIGGNLIAAGHETSTHFIGTALRVLLSHPEHWRAIQADPSLLPRYLEETLRFDSTSHGMVRTVREQTTLGGVTLPVGARIYLLYGAANRDPAHFAAPNTYDPHRRDVADHLGFGRGIHYCAGAGLARLEGQIAISKLQARLPGLRLVPDQTVQYVPNLAIRGLASLWLEWDALA